MSALYALKIEVTLNVNLLWRIWAHFDMHFYIWHGIRLCCSLLWKQLSVLNMVKCTWCDMSTMKVNNCNLVGNYASCFCFFLLFIFFFFSSKVATLFSLLEGKIISLVVGNSFFFFVGRNQTFSLGGLKKFLFLMGKLNHFQFFLVGSTHSFWSTEDLRI